MGPSKREQTQPEPLQDSSDPGGNAPPHEWSDPIHRLGSAVLLLSTVVVWVTGEVAVRAALEPMVGLAWILLGRWLPRLVFLLVAAFATKRVVFGARPPKALPWMGFAVLVVVSWVYTINWVYAYVNYGPMPAVIR